MELIKPNTNINFVGRRYYAFALSGMLLILALASIPIMGKIHMGIDFTGGVMVQVKFNKDVHVDEIRGALQSLGENLIVQKYSVIGGPEEFVIRMEEPKEGSDKVGDRVKGLLEETIGKGTAEIRSVEIVGPKVGKDLRQAAVLATLLALGMILIYMAFRFDFSMGLGAVVCLFHDVLMVYGFFVWSGKEFNLTILAAVLTVVGYDVHDTIVVCDRIRENLGIMRKKPLEEIMNLSINQTLSRTILTSGFTLLVVLSLLVFGTNVLRDFSWALAIGIVLGTYSSIFVAIPLVLVWDKHIPIKRN